MQNSPIDVIIATVNGPYGEIHKEGAKSRLDLSYPGGSLGAQGEYRIDENGEWFPIPEAGIQVPASPGTMMQIRALNKGAVAQGCEKVPPESEIEAAFKFSWIEPNMPNVTIEVQERTIEPG